MSKNVIHAGGLFPNPMLNREGAASVELMPGTICVFEDGKVKQSANGGENAIKYIANMDYLRCKTVKDKFETGDWVVCMHPMAGVFFNVTAVAGSYKKGEPLKIVNGQVATGGDASSVFYVEESDTINTDGDLLRVLVK